MLHRIPPRRLRTGRPECWISAENDADIGHSNAAEKHRVGSAQPTDDQADGQTDGST